MQDDQEENRDGDPFVSRDETAALMSGKDSYVLRELDLHEVDSTYLIRDRLGLDPDEMESLMSSLKMRGQQVPIEVADLGERAMPRYGLISGWRRLHALRRLSEGGETTPTILAFLRAPGQSGDAYLAMVEENEIRVGLSYYERARIVVKSVEQGAFPDAKTALQSLFHAASRSKRSKIRSFITVVEALDGAITFPDFLGERLGLLLARALDRDPDFGPRLRRALNNTLATDSAGEQAVIVRQLARRKHFDETALPVASDSRQLGRGLAYTRYGNGNVLLSGPDLSGKLWRELLDWLTARYLKE